VNPVALFGGPHINCESREHFHLCPVCAGTIERAGLVWIGTQFYKTPDAFLQEGAALGFSRRVTTIPRGFKVGETWVLLAHPKAIVLADSPKGDEMPGDVTPGIFFVWKPERIEKILPESTRGSDDVKALEEKGITPVFVPDNDPDHQGSVYDKGEEPELPLTDSEERTNDGLPRVMRFVDPQTGEDLGTVEVTDLVEVGR
jgi:hypothetical protein